MNRRTASGLTILALLLLLAACAGSATFQNVGSDLSGGGDAGATNPPDPAASAGTGELPGDIAHLLQ